MVMSASGAAFCSAVAWPGSGVGLPSLPSPPLTPSFVSDFEACLRTEFRIVSRVVTGHDFYEGIRAVIMDKDQRPRWQPASLDAVREADVRQHFAPLTAELELP